MPHIAIIMDGNGRWAQARRRPRLFGHHEGVKTVRRIVQDARDIGVKYLTLYSFSTENWNRPRTEIRALFDLLKRYVEDDLEELHCNNVRVRIIGRQDGLPDDILRVINHVETRTRENTAFSLNIAFNYGGRDEILRACRMAIKTGILPDDLDEAKFEQLLDTADLPEPDLVIRTSGEYRISNFLLWQAAYAELMFTDVLWPDFKKSDLEAAIESYFARNRRYGGLDTADVA
ncbi:isoprenyl transferase [Robiginitomaculum antarcticum]|uniref:isoprenyl transferase n=1 Tax=Robiginitomaculum antarcticum TaxID=437507 RepID=UPI00037486EF|nr:isoprenyl transferase [Robiginitomaculum antarcticum]